MDLWNVFGKEVQRPGYGTKQITLNTGARHNLSLKMVSAGTSLSPGEWTFRPYSEEKRYLVMSDIGLDLLVTLFDVNSGSVLAIRTQTDITEADAAAARRSLSAIKRPNIEMRAIGLQNNSNGPEGTILKARKLLPNVLAEIDLFGDSKRHIVMDTKTGMTYNLLMLNRIYRPGELLNQGGEAAASPPTARPLKLV